MPIKALPPLLLPWTRRKKAPSCELGCAGDTLLELALHPGDWHCLTYQQTVPWREQKRLLGAGGCAAEAPGHQHRQTALPRTLRQGYCRPWLPKYFHALFEGRKVSHTTREGNPGVKKSESKQTIYVRECWFVFLPPWRAVNPLLPYCTLRLKT